MTLTPLKIGDDAARCRAHDAPENVPVSGAMVRRGRAHGCAFSGWTPYSQAVA